MSLRFIQRTLKSLQNSYGSNNIKLSKYTVGAVDFTTATPTNSVDTITIRGIALPKNLNVAFLPKMSPFTIDKKSREFVLTDPRVTADWVKDGNYLDYLGERYNIKSSEMLEGYYYFIRAIANGDEIGDD